MKTTICVAIVCLFAFALPMMASASPATWVTEAEDASGGQVVADEDASGGNAVSRTSTGIYTWWTFGAGSVPVGHYGVWVRARTADGAGHSYGEHVVVDDVTIAVLTANVTSNAYRWYYLGDFALTGTTLRLADWSAANINVDKVRMESIPWTEAEGVSGGTIVADGNASNGQAVTRTTIGIYTWWVVDSAKLRHGRYSLYARLRSADGAGHSFGGVAVVNGSTIANQGTVVSNQTYAWYKVLSFEYKGSNLRLADWSDANIRVDELRLVQDRPADQTLVLYHLWYGNAALGETSVAQAENVPGGTVVDDLNANNGQAVTRTTTGVYTWWVVDPAYLIPGSTYALHVRARSTDGLAHNFGGHVVVDNVTIATHSASITGNSYAWFKSSRFQYDGSSLRLADWSEANISIDELRLVRDAEPNATSDYQKIGFYAPGQPGTNGTGITGSPGRLAVVKADSSHAYGYFRQAVPNTINEFAIYAGISTDGGANFEVHPTPIVAPGYVPGLGELLTAYDPDVIKRSDGFYMVFEGAGLGCATGSMIAYSTNGLTNWQVRNASVCPSDWTISASTPNFVIDPESGTRYLQWVNVDVDAMLTTRHQAPFASDLFTRITSDPSIGQLPQSPSGAWDARNFGSGNVMLEDGMFYMFFEGANNPGCGGQWGLGFARTTTENLPNPALWEKQAANPLLLAINANSCWMSYPEIVKLGDTYYLYYDNPEIGWQPNPLLTMFRRTINLLP